MSKKRYVDQSGYVCIKIPGHPHAATNGWASEHRVIMSDILRRPLQKEEIIHHKDGNKQNNDPGNLELMTRAQHIQKHSDNTETRRTGSPNPTIICACGCNNFLKKYDERGRPRAYIHGHRNPNIQPLAGESLGQSKLTTEEALRIRALWTEGNYLKSQLGRMFKVKQSTIHSIIERRTWKHI